MKKYVLLLCLIFSAQTGYCLYPFALSGLRTELRRVVNDNDTDSSLWRWSNAVLDERINACQDDFVSKSKCSEGRWYINLTSNTAEYALPTNLLKVKRVSFHINNSTGAYKRIIQYSRKENDRDNWQWENMAGGEPNRYVLRPSTSGYNIILNPKPSSSYSGTEYLAIDYVVNVASMTNDTDYPFNNDQRLYPYHLALVYGAAIQCFIDTHDTSMRDYCEGKYNAYLGLARDGSWGVWDEPDYSPNFPR